MADKDDDRPKPVVRKIPEGVSGLGKDYPSPEPSNTVGSMGGKTMGGYSEFGSTMGGTWKRPSNYAKGGQVGKVGGFGLKRSKPDFAGGGGMQNFKNWSKKNG